MTTPPLFILAPGRSFTSITCAMLGCHPQMFGLAEINLFAKETVGELSDLYRLRARLQNGLLRSLSQLAFSAQTTETVESVRGWLDENAGLTTAELFRTMEEWAGGRGLIDKSPLHVLSPEALKRMAIAAPEARYLHLTRHPGDTMKSMLQLRNMVRDKARARFPALANRPAERVDPAETERMWLDPHLNILEFLETIPPDRQLRLRGEDLLSDPPAHLARLAEWLRIGADQTDIDAMMHPENSPFAAFGPANARYGNDPSFMERPHLRPYKHEPRPLTWETPDGAVAELGEAVRARAATFGY